VDGVQDGRQVRQQAIVGAGSIARGFRGRWWLLVFVLLPVLGLFGAPDHPQRIARHTFEISGRQFLLDGKPFQIISGEMHYPRIPREYWRDRLKMARAMGLNTISTYVFWNLHEPRPGIYDFSGQLDVAEFIRMAQEEGLFVILRPGPYVCAEWDLGGLPSWLLADPKMILRSNDPKFMEPAGRWLARLGKELAPLQLAHGGPIIAVQVENEYGSFDSDKVYLKHIYDLIANAGFGGSLLYTADGPERLANGTLPGVPAVANFGPGEAKEAFAKLAAFRPNQPLMAGEYWAGWFDSWGGKHAATDAALQTRELEWMLAQGYSVNLYMFHGGTTFGFMNGANFEKAYQPETSSYDYDAALDESGRPTAKYYEFRKVIAAHDPGNKLPEVSIARPLISVPEFRLSEVSSLWANLGTAIESEDLRPMEMVGQSYGYILYQTQIAGPISGELRLEGMNDYAKVYLNGTERGTLDTRLDQNALALHSEASKNTLQILVENGGRINFSKHLRDQRKGLSGTVTLGGTPLHGWKIYPLPMAGSSDVAFHRTKSGGSGPALNQGHFTLSKTGDTFLRISGTGKGTAWVNGHALGRFWDIGPQQTLYLPAPWLKVGVNEVVVFALDGDAELKVQGLSRPVFGN
jgi:beta-galactosidase